MPLPDLRALADPSRLAALAACDLLDTEADERYDRLTRLVARLIGAPMASFTLVDGSRQFWKSVTGQVPEPWAARRGTPLSHSICAHVVASGEPIVVSDARRDARLSDSGAITDLHVIAYAGVPVRTTSGAVLGSLCVMDTVPREWTVDQVAVLQGISECLSA